LNTFTKESEWYGLLCVSSLICCMIVYWVNKLCVYYYLIIFV